MPPRNRAAAEEPKPERVDEAAAPVEGSAGEPSSFGDQLAAEGGGPVADPDVDVDEPGEVAVTMADTAALTGTPAEPKRKRDVSYQDAVKQAKAADAPFISAAMAEDFRNGAKFVVDPGSGRRVTREEFEDLFGAL